MVVVVVVTGGELGRLLLMGLAVLPPAGDAELSPVGKLSVAGSSLLITGITGSLLGSADTTGLRRLRNGEDC